MFFDWNLWPKILCKLEFYKRWKNNEYFHTSVFLQALNEKVSFLLVKVYHVELLSAENSLLLTTLLHKNEE